MSRFYLQVEGCDDATVIAIDNATPAEKNLIEGLVIAINEASTGHCEPTATILAQDPWADEDEPGGRYPDRPLVVLDPHPTQTSQDSSNSLVTTGGNPTEDPEGVSEYA